MAIMGRNGSINVRRPSGAKGQDMKLKEIIKDNHVRFLRYRQGVLYYAVTVPGVSSKLMFPVPVADVGDATVEAQEKAIMLMRYIRKAIAQGTLVPAFKDRTAPQRE
jgi:hypothetical protein